MFQSYKRQFKVASYCLNLCAIKQFLKLQVKTLGSLKDAGKGQQRIRRVVTWWLNYIFKYLIISCVNHKKEPF